MQIVHSNRRESLTEIEEAWIIRALHREDDGSRSLRGCSARATSPPVKVLHRCRAYRILRARL